MKNSNRSIQSKTFYRLMCACFLLISSSSYAQTVLHNGSFRDVEVKHFNSMELTLQFALILENRNSLQSTNLLPIDAKVQSTRVLSTELIITMDLPQEYLIKDFNEHTLEQLSRLVDLNLDYIDPTIRKVHFNVIHNGKKVALSNFLKIDPVPNKPDDQYNRGQQISSGKQTKGTVNDLSDKTLFISQAHGWIDYSDSREWSTQRGNTHNIVEDFVNSEGINQYLLQYLEGAGASVFTLRERDLNTEMVIVDNDDPGYLEIGDSGLFADSGANGFANNQAPYGSTTDPFRDNGGSDRVITTSLTESAQAVWPLVVTQSDYYDVYVSYSGIGNRASDAKYTVRHGGIDTVHEVDQTKHRYVWNYLGNYYFEVGGDHAIILSNQSQQAGTTVSADAVRLGGGMGDVIGHNHGELSSKPRWEEGARTWTQFQGASSSVYQNGDVSARSRFADWEHYSVEDSVYISWHSNAFNGTAKGTSTYIYSANPPDGTYDDTQAHPGSAELQTAIHNELINDITADWDANWTDRGKRSAYFGEINPTHNDEMPAMLIEMAFHDNADDADALRHPKFRQLVARSIYQGIVKYFADRDQLSLTLLPEPPTHLQVTSPTPGTIHIQWQAPPTDNLGILGDAADSYLVYLSDDGKNFDNGTAVIGTSTTITNQTPGDIKYVKVKAINAGGHSLDSETLAARVKYPSEQRTLIINGFDRLNSGQLIAQDMTGDGLGTVDRMYLKQMNTFDYVIQHGEALNDSGVGFDAISNELIEDALFTLDPADYTAITWILGEESSLGSTLTSAEQSELNSYLNAGGKLFISGAEIAWDLDHLGSGADQTFYHDTLMTAYWADDANTYTANGEAGSPYENISNLVFDDGTGGSYHVEYADVLTPLPSANSCLQYLGSQSACTYVDTGTYQVIHLGFPFETIVSQTIRNNLMAETMNYFSIPYFSDVIFVDGFDGTD